MSTGPGGTAATVTARQVLAHALLTAGVVGGLTLALMIAPPAPAPTTPAEPPAVPTPVGRGTDVLEPTLPLPLPDLAGRVVAGTRAFPVAGAADYARDHHDYPATDVFVPCGTPVLAVAASEVAETTTADTWDRGSNLGPDRAGCR